MANSADPSTVLPLEHVAPVYVERRDGYVDIQQPRGDQTLYTPEEARDIAYEILRAADAVGDGPTVASGLPEAERDG